MTITMQGLHSQLSMMQKNPNFEVTLKNLSQWIAKYRLRALGQGACLKGMSRTITMQGFTLMAITDAEKTKLRHNCDIKINKVNGP